MTAEEKCRRTDDDFEYLKKYHLSEVTMSSIKKFYEYKKHISDKAFLSEIPAERTSRKLNAFVHYAYSFFCCKFALKF